MATLIITYYNTNGGYDTVEFDGVSAPESRVREAIAEHGFWVQNETDYYFVPWSQVNRVDVVD